MVNHADTATVVAARDGDPHAVDRLVAEYLPLVYTIVGRALEGHADVDDVVQDTMLRVVRRIGDLHQPESFRSWLVAITMRQVRERFRARRDAPHAVVPDDVHHPGADFTDLAITRLELTGQRRETAEATRWLDEDARELLALTSVTQPGIGAAIWLHATDVQAIHDGLVADGRTIVAAPVDGPFGRTFTFADPDGYHVTLHDRA